MSAWIEKFVIPLALLILGGLGTVAWQYITRPDSVYLTASLLSVDVPNPFYSADGKQLSDFEKSIGALTGFNLSSEPYRFERSIRIAVVTFRNLSNLRTKEIELISKKDSVLVSPNASEKISKNVTRIKIKPIDPQGTAVAYGVITGWPYSVAQNLTAIYDDKALPIISEDKFDVDDPYLALGIIVARYPIVISALTVVGILALLIMLISIPLGIAQSYSLSLRNKYTNDTLLKQTVDFIRYVEREHPERIAKLNVAAAENVKVG
jgi:hypothetical protein